MTANSPVVVESVLELVGGTPLVRIDGSRGRAAGPGGTVWAKMEQLNPGGSVKDRICLAILEQAERDGSLKPGGVVVEPTSGNTGIGLALACAVKGYRCVLTMPESMSLERRQLLKAFGAEIVLTPAEAQMDGAIARADELVRTTPNAFGPSQFANPANPRIHENTTANEILMAMTGLTIDAVVFGVGTGGTVSGVGAAMKRELGSGVRVIAVEPDACATISRGERGPTKIQGLAAGFVPKNYDASVVDEVRTVTDEDAWRCKEWLATTQGLLVGISAGASMAIALDLAAELGPTQNVVTLLCDTGERYFSLAHYFEGTSA